MAHSILGSDCTWPSKRGHHLTASSLCVSPFVAQGILSDLFPGVTVPYVDYGRLQTAIEAELIKEQYQPVPSFITKVIQVRTTTSPRGPSARISE